MGEALGSVAFGWYERSTGRAVKPDPRFISFKMMVGSRNRNYSTNVEKIVEFETINSEKHPEYFQ